MIIPDKHTSVLIVGAGPSGLMMAAQLLRHGVQPVIIDSKQGPTSHSKALAVQARSLEIYRQLGIVEGILKNGRQAEGIKFYQNGSKKAELSLNNIGKDQTLFPFAHMYQQSKNERALLEYLTTNCCPVYWNTSLLSLQQQEGQTEVQLENENQQYALTCNWLIGADGARSTVRKQLAIAFDGDTYEHNFYLADVKLKEDEHDQDFVQLYLMNQGFAAFFPMPEAHNYRIVGNLPSKLNREEAVLETVLPYINRVSGADIAVKESYWFTIYRLHHRMAEAFNKQNCFLIGDAAHIHSPVGGQGMNTGLQDAYNLGWKLAMVVNQQIKPGILSSYAAERMPVAKQLLSTTDKAFTLLMSDKWLAALFKKWAFARLLKFLWSKPVIREEFFRRVSQIGISYRQSSINLHLSQSVKVKAGDRLPYIKVFDEKKQHDTDLQEWCTKPGFTLIVLGKVQEIDLFTLAKWITQNYQAKLNFFYLPYSVRNKAVFDAFDIKQNQKKALIIRPDTHIGYINDVVDIGMMDNYLHNVVGFI